MRLATDCRDETAARSVLADLERRAELAKAGVMTTAEDAMADHLQTPLIDHCDSYLEHLRAKGVTPGRIKTVRQRFLSVTKDRQLRRLSDLSATELERWLLCKADEGMSAGSRNAYREACVGFGNWCKRTHRLKENPFADVSRADQKADQRRKRRALTEPELVKLLEVARRRPLLEAMTIRRGKNKGQPVAVLRDKTRRRLELLGWERTLLYKTLVLTGLRKSELASLTVGQLDFDGPVAYASLDAGDEKARRGAQIPLRADLAADLSPMAQQQARSDSGRSQAAGRGASRTASR